MRSDELVGLLDAYFGTREVRGDEWADLFELVYPEPYWRSGKASSPATTWPVTARGYCRNPQ